MKTTASIPNKLLKNSVFIRRIRVNPTSVIQVLIDCHGKLFEISDGSVINVCSLEKFQAANNIEFQLFFTYQSSNRKVYYLIKSEKNLNIIERTSSLQLIKVFENVQDVQIRDSNLGHPQVEIRLHDEMSLIVTDFSGNESSKPQDDNLFDDFYKQAHKMLHEERIKNRDAENTYSELYQKVCDEVKFCPRHLRSENQLEKVILVPYANNWKRVHNGKLIVGLPILNTTFQRPIVAEEISATVFCDTMEDLEFTSCLYRCAEDYHSMEELKRKLESFGDNGEGDAENVLDLNKRLKFEQEWTVSENGNLHGEESGIVIVTLDLEMLINSTVEAKKDLFNFNFFINYHVVDEKNVQHELQLHFGDIQIDQKELLSIKLWVNFESEALIDLLAVKTTTNSVHLSFEYRFSSTNDTEIQDFLIKNLGFRNFFENNSPETLHTINFDSIASNEQSLSSLLYQNDGFLKGMVVRLQKTDSQTFDAKIYGKESQLVSILKAFISEFDDNCKISSKEETFTKEKLTQELRYSLIDEIRHLSDTKGNFEEFLEAQNSLEEASDLVYERLSSLIACKK